MAFSFHGESTLAGENAAPETVYYLDHDVLFCWTMVAVNWVEEEACALMRLFVEHWVSVRGFSYVSSFVEKYKQRKKKAVQKSKGLRKKLNLASASNEKKTSAVEKKEE